MCSINWTYTRGNILFYKILSKRFPWAFKDEEPCLFYCKDTPNSLGGMRLLELQGIRTSLINSKDFPLQKLDISNSTTYLWTMPC